MKPSRSSRPGPLPVLAWVLSAMLPAAAHADDDDRRPVMVCGPSCVQHVLRAYGQDVDLVDLIMDIQGGDPKRSSSMLDVQRALESRGVHTAVVDVGALGFVRSHCPAIIHYRRGHFAVVEEVGGLYAKVTDGAGVPGTWRPIPSVMMGQSGVVLLTSGSAISHETIRLTMWPRLFAALAVVAVGVTGSLLVRRCFFRVTRTNGGST